MPTPHSTTFTQKLKGLNSTQTSIQQLSLWIVYHRKKAVESMNVWKEHILNPDIRSERILNLIYLANDFLQNSKKKTNVFIEEFEKFLPEVLKDIVPRMSPHDVQRLQRVLSIWESRNIFSGELMSQLKNIVSSLSNGIEPAVVQKHTPELKSTNNRVYKSDRNQRYEKRFENAKVQNSSPENVISKHLSWVKQLIKDFKEEEQEKEERIKELKEELKKETEAKQILSTLFLPQWEARSNTLNDFLQEASKHAGDKRKRDLFTDRNDEDFYPPKKSKQENLESQVFNQDKDAIDAMNILEMLDLPE